MLSEYSEMNKTYTDTKEHKIRVQMIYPSQFRRSNYCQQWNLSSDFINGFWTVINNLMRIIRSLFVCCSLSSALHQGLTEVLLGIAMFWAALQSQFKVWDSLHDAALVSVPANYHTDLESDHQLSTAISICKIEFCFHEPHRTPILMLTNTEDAFLHFYQIFRPINESESLLYNSKISPNSQSSSRHQRFHIVGVYFQGLIILIHGLHVSAMFEVIHTQTHAEGKRRNRGEQTNDRFMVVCGYCSWKHIHTLKLQLRDLHEHRSWRSVCIIMVVINIWPRLHTLYYGLVSLNFSLPFQGPWGWLFLPNYRSKILLFEVFAVKKRSKKKRKGFEKGSRLPGYRFEDIVWKDFKRILKTDLCSPLITDGGWVSLIPSFSSR